MKNNGESVHDKGRMENLLQEQYKSVFAQPNKKDEIPDIIKFSNENVKGHLMDLDITEVNIIDIINQMPSNSAAGKDEIRSSYLKKAKYGVAPDLAQLFRNCLDSYKGLEDPYEATIIPILKSGKPKEQASS